MFIWGRGVGGVFFMKIMCQKSRDTVPLRTAVAFQLTEKINLKGHHTSVQLRQNSNIKWKRYVLI